MLFINKLNSYFVVASFSEVISFFRKQLKEKKSLIFLPFSLNDFVNSEKDNLDLVYKEVDFATTDGMPVVLYFSLLNYLNKLGLSKIDRIYGPDLMESLLSNDSKFKHFFCGTTEDTLSRLEKRIRLKNKNIKIVGSYDPPFSEVGFYKNMVLDQVKRAKADILWIGLSSPKQVELAAFIKSKHKNIKIFCVGAAFDFLSGTKKQAPSFMQKTGFEWLFRMLTEPRLLKRYLFNIPCFLIKKSGTKLLQSFNSR